MSNVVVMVAISHVTVTVSHTGTDGPGGARLQLTLYTYSARWLTEVSLSLSACPHSGYTNYQPVTPTGTFYIHIMSHYTLYTIHL